VLLLGPSGGGKSSLLLAIAGLHDRVTAAETEGSLDVLGREARDAADEVGIVFQDPETQLVMGRAGDDVAFGLEERCVPTAEIWPRVDAALRSVGFPYARDRRTDALSGGEKQRLALAGVLALRPRVLLLDEPTADLDPDGAASFYEALAHVDHGTTVVLVEHRVSAVLPLVDRVVAIDGARGVIADGPPHRVFSERRSELDGAGIWVPDARIPASRAPGPGEALVSAEAVGFRYPGAGRDALTAESVEVREGEALAVVGLNGSGKSTLLLLLGGLLAPDSGRVSAPRLDGREPRPARWRARDLPARVGSVFQDPEHQFVATRVEDEVLAGPLAARVPAADARRAADALLERLGLWRLRDAEPHTLSGGEKRRLGLAAVLAARPRALLLDEPTYGQDRRTFLEVVRILAEERARGVAIAFSTHEPALVEALADRRHDLGRSA